METIVRRMYLSDWKRLTRLIKPRKDETYANYMKRIVQRLETYKK